MSDPTVSVVIPAYNVANLIGATLDSVLNQTYRDFEVRILKLSSLMMDQPMQRVKL